ncbi:C39 family peptidase [Tyzzerella sp. OttesenSCG-928-J15]|nr:C39 family peptidase [Tyzzerella sp. OttesenSCG-928-J15]
MRKFLVFVILCLIILCGFQIHNLYLIVSSHQESLAAKDSTYYTEIRQTEEDNEEYDIVYDVFINNEYDSSYEYYSEAVNYAKSITNSAIYEKHTSSWVWDNYPPFELNVNNVRIMYSSFAQAVADSAQYENPYITFKNSSSTVWEENYANKGAYFMDVTPIKQLPELPRGCEVTSLTMLLNYKGVEVSKMTLADEIERHENNPYKGFVGDMYSFSNSGYGVYHDPLFDLLHKYLPETAMDITYCDFDDLYYLLDNNCPVVVIINSTYAKLPGSSFKLWKTDEENILITYSEHAVLITGYDEKYIYFNDPLGKTLRAEKTGFIEAWEQMGRQAVTVAPLN